MNPTPDHISAAQVILTILGLVISALLTVLIAQIRGLGKKHDETSGKLTDHMLAMATAMAGKMGLADCNVAQTKCSQRVMDCLEERDKEQEILWHALRGHRHTNIPGRDDEVIIPQRPAAAAGR